MPGQSEALAQLVDGGLGVVPAQLRYQSIDRIAGHQAGDEEVDRDGGPEGHQVEADPAVQEGHDVSTLLVGCGRRLVSDDDCQA